MNAQATQTERFRFASQALPEETLHVIRFKGREGLNELFSFTIDLVSPNPALDLGKLLSDRATFRVLREEGREALFCGYPASARQSGHFNGYSYYTVELRPTFWKMTQIVQSAIFLEQTLRDTVQELLRSQQFFTFPNQMELTRGDYPRRDFAMQYDESIYDYLCWRLENEGAYYYFAQSEREDTVCFADNPVAHRPLPDDPELAYSPVSGLEGEHIREILLAFSLTQTQRPKRVVIRSHSWKNPNKPIVGMADVSTDGLGDVYLTDEDVESDADAGRLAKIRAEALRCRERVFSGESSIPGLRPGYTFHLKGHYNSGFDQDYLVTDVTHEGSQESFINLGLGIPLEGVKDHLYYRNSFHCIEANRPFRPEKRAPRAKIAGVVHAFIDGARTDARPELDSLGRYKILFPFDVSGRGQGKASCWVRMAQPQVGKHSGMSFPLLVGTEVLVSFVDGNPDRPCITGALANAETGALTGSGNSNISGFSTAGGNHLVFNDAAKEQGVGLTTAGGSGIVMSAGSFDALVSQSNIYGNIATVGATQTANLLHSTFSGRTILQSVLAPEWRKYLFAITKAGKAVLEGVQQKFLDSGVITALPAFASIDVAKALFMLGDRLGESIAYGKDRGSIYGYTVRSNEYGSMSKLQTPVDKVDIIGDIVATIGGAVAQISSGLNEVEKNAEGDKEKYTAEIKELAQKHVYARTLSDNIAEIIAIVVLAYRGKNLDKKKMGGVLLHAENANIGLHAKDAIHLDTPGGLLLRAGNARQDDLNSFYKAPSIVEAQPIVEVPPIVEGPAQYQPILQWGSKDFNDASANIGKLFNFTKKDAMSYVFGNGEAHAENYQQNGYLADISNIRYTHTSNLVENVENTRKSLAKKHIIVSGENNDGSALVVQTAQDSSDTNIQAPGTKGGIYLGTRGEGKVIWLDTPKTKITQDDDGLKLEHKDDKKPSIAIKDKTLELALDEGQVSVALAENLLELKCKNGEISIKNDQIEMKNSATKLKLGNLTFDGAASEIKSSGGQLSIQGGIIKIG